MSYGLNIEMHKQVSERGSGGRWAGDFAGKRPPLSPWSRSGTGDAARPWVWGCHAKWFSGSQAGCCGTGSPPHVPKHLSEPGHEPCVRTSLRPQMQEGVWRALQEPEPRGKWILSFFKSLFPFPKPEECFHPSLVPLLFQR